MAKLHACGCCLIATLLISFALPSLQLNSSRRAFSLHLHLQLPPPLNLHNLTLQPLTPYFFSDQPLFYFDERSQDYLHVATACGLYLVDPAGNMELRHLFFTATLRKFQGSLILSKDAEGSSLVLLGSPDSGAISVIGGTGSFAFASGQAKVSMGAAAGLKSQQRSLRVLLDVELQYEEDDPEIWLPPLQ